MLCSLLFVVFLLWWLNPTTKNWLWVSWLATFALSAKFSSLPIVALLPALALIRGGRIDFPYLKLCFVYAFVIAIFIVPYSFVRYKQEMRFSIIPNTSALDTNLKLENRPSYFYTFSPMAILENPYVNPWEDSTRRGYPLESLFRSSFTGEFNLGESGKGPLFALHLLGFLSILLALLGMIKKGDGIKAPAVGVLLFTLISILLNRYSNPFGSTVNLRYSTYAIIPLAILAGIGMPKLFCGKSVLAKCTVYACLVIGTAASFKILYLFIKNH